MPGLVVCDAEMRLQCERIGFTNCRFQEHGEKSKNLKTSFKLAEWQVTIVFNRKMYAYNRRYWVGSTTIHVGNRYGPLVFISN